MIHIIEGGSGSGKTALLYDTLGKLAESGAEKLLYLIPEQSSFECESAFLKMLGPEVSRRVSVMSFTRLYNFVLNSEYADAGACPRTDTETNIMPDAGAKISSQTKDGCVLPAGACLQTDTETNIMPDAGAKISSQTKDGCVLPAGACLQTDTETNIMPDAGAKISSQTKDGCVLPAGACLLPIDDGIRKIIMSYTLEDCADLLNVYKKQANRPQFAEIALGAVKELKQCGVLPDRLSEASGQAGSAELKNKLHELSVIYGLYNANVAQSGVDPYDNETRLYQRALDTGFFRGWTIAVDDFSGFTAVQFKIIELMMSAADEFYISLCIDGAAEEDLFFTVERTKKRILDSARRSSLDVASVVRLGENKRTKSEQLKYLERNIYRRVQYGEEPQESDCAAVVQANDVYDECEYIAARINDMAFSGECRYRDIAVVFRSSEKYEGVLDAVLEKHSVPFFMSRPEPVFTKPIMRLAVSAPEFALSPNDESKLFDAMKSGFMGISPYSAACVENYMFVWGLKGRDMLSDFKFDPKGYSEGLSEESVKELAALNEVRERCVSPFKKFMAKLESGDGAYTAREIAQALYEFMVDCGVPKRLKMRAEKKLEFSDENLRLWSMLCGVLDKMHSALGDRRITLRRFYELFVLELKDEDISDIPQTLDQVIVGRADSVRLDKPYAVFVIGALSGEFPHRPVPDGVFSDAERGRLISLGLPLYDTVSDLYRQEKYLVYCAVSAPTNKLFVTYPAGSLSGGEAQPSSIVTELQRIFRGLQIKKTSRLGDIDRISNERTAFELYASKRKENTPFAAALGKYLSHTSDYRGRLKALGKGIKNIDERISDPDTAAALFGHNKRLSPTQIESFYQCRFMYFCSYGAKLRDRRRAALDPLVYGNLLHYVLDRVVSEYIAREYEPFEDEELKTLIDTLLEKYVTQELGGTQDKTKQFMHFCERSKSRLLTVVDHVMQEIMQSGFDPVDTELEIGRYGGGIAEYEIVDGHGSTVLVNGKIDRLDLMKSGDGAYVRVIDYKSNGKKFSLDEVINGLNLQMLIYLMTAEKNGVARYNMPLSSAAVLYMKADSGRVTIKTSGGESREELDKQTAAQIDEELRMTGMSLDEDLIENAHNSGERKFVNAQGVSRRQLSMIFDMVEKKLTEMSEELDDGYIAAVPSKNSGTQKYICDWCSWRDICRIERADAVRMIGAKDNKAVLEEFDAKNEEEEETVNE